MMCHLTTIVSGAVSLGVLAGVLSGIVYVVLFGLKWVGKLRVSLEEEALKGRRDERFFGDSLCTKCRTYSGTLSAESEQCCDTSCNGSVCSSANRLKKRGSRRISEIWSEEKDADTLDHKDSNDAKTVRIREEIEKLVEEMVGGSLDGISVGKLSNHSTYLAMFAKHHEPVCQALAKLGYALHISLLNKNGADLESARVAHSTLKTLVEKVVAEATKLPNIGDILHGPNSAEEIGNDSSISNKSYEDILATAILNKVIEQCQKRGVLAKSKKYRRPNVLRNCNNNIISNEDEDNDVMYNSDWSDTSRSEQLSLTIEEHIEEITTTYENSEEEEFNEEVNYSGAIPFPESGRIILNEERGHSEEDGDMHSSVTELITTGNSWKENWLFQKKRLRSGAKSHHPVPVPMLVPNPSQDFRALIGGVDADDLSDMSECDDSVLEDIVLAADDDKDHSQSEDVKEDEGTEVTQVTEVEESADSPLSLNTESSCPSLSQKERDVSVDYECFRKFEVEIREPPPPRPGSLDFPITEDEEYNAPIKCLIAEREKEKWNHPVPLADNPYSAENILKREQRKKMEYFRTRYRTEEALEFPSNPSEEPSYEIYSRDYYIKASRCPTGDPSLRSAPEKPEEVRKHMSEPKECEPKEDEMRKDGHGPVEDIKEVYSKTDQRKAVDYWEEGVLRNKIAEATNIVLPNVKELTKKFAKGIEEFTPKPSPTPSVASQKYSNPMPEPKTERATSLKKPIADCVIANNNVSSSDSVTNRSNIVEAADQEIQTNESFLNKTFNTKTANRMDDDEKNKKCESGESEAIKILSSVTFAMSTGKEVHSLTARSISREFREELKNNSSRKVLPKIDRGSSGESDYIEIVSESMRNRSPTPPIDLQSKKKFWEDIISNSQKKSAF